MNGVSISYATVFQNGSSFIVAWKDPICEVASRAFKQAFSNTALPLQFKRILVYGTTALIVVNAFALRLLENRYLLNGKLLIPEEVSFCLCSLALSSYFDFPLILGSLCFLCMEDFLTYLERSLF